MLLSLSCREGKVCVCVGPTIFVKKSGDFMSTIMCFMTISYFSSKQPFHFSENSEPLRCTLFRKGKRDSPNWEKGRVAGGKKTYRNQEFWVPRHNPHNQMIPAPELWRFSALAQKEVGPGGIFSNPYHCFKGKHIKQQEVSGSK